MGFPDITRGEPVLRGRVALRSMFWCDAPVLRIRSGVRSADALRGGAKGVMGVMFVLMGIICVVF